MSTSNVEENVAHSYEIPPQMRADDPSAADPARRRLARKSPFPRFPSLPNLRAKRVTSKLHLPRSLESLPQQPSEDLEIHIDYNLSPDLPDDKDVYRWAMVYENQRGITLFSTPFYSRYSLLPRDPEPFTIPNKATGGVYQPSLSLSNYPLPDGTWRWVSKAWMVDMRTDFGQVQHDGFEYNWLFRDKHWHPHIGTLGAGAWVRRRRWVRLMMRPAKRKLGVEAPSGGDQTVVSPSQSRASSSPHLSTSNASLMHPTSEATLIELEREAIQVWEGGVQDRRSIHRLLKHLGRDGRKLELWRMWLGPYARLSDVKGKGKQITGDTVSLSSQRGKRLSDTISEGNPPPLACLVAILQNNAETILRSFVYPDSRAQFVDLVRRAGLAEDLESGLGRACSVSDLDFWSYANELDQQLGEDRGRSPNVDPGQVKVDPSQGTLLHQPFVLRTSSPVPQQGLP